MGYHTGSVLKPGERVRSGDAYMYINIQLYVYINSKDIVVKV